jgi:hypothetical protein
MGGIITSFPHTSWYRVIHSSQENLLRFYAKLFQIVFAFGICKQRFYIKITNVLVMTPHAFWQIDELAHEFRVHYPDDGGGRSFQTFLPIKQIIPLHVAGEYA